MLNNWGAEKIIQGTQEEYIEEIAQYLSLYRIIIAIDNLETISSGPLRELLLKVPSQSKLLLTSRVGVGEFEVRYPLQGLDEKSGLALFRAQARILNVTALQKLDDGNIKGYCKKLFYNPLLIKWFIASVGRGASPNALTNRADATFPNALAFCFENLFERLGAAERSVVDCIVSARHPLTSAEIHFLMPALSGLDAEVALGALHNSSILIRSKKGSDSFEYFLSESAMAFASAKAPPDPIFFRRVQNGLKELRAILSQEIILESRYDYDPFFVRVGAGRDERICATYLRRALDSLKQRNFAGARRDLLEAKRLAPHSGEVFRISALAEALGSDHYRASEDYEHAIELDPSSKITRYCYGMFLMTDLDDLDGALEQFHAAEKVDAKAAPVLTAKAMALTRMAKFEQAAALHDELLPSMRNRERRWRISGADQAADCYRRWGHRCWEQKEYSEAREKFKRAVAILLDSTARGDLDIKLLQKAARVVNDALSKRELTDDRAFVEFIIDNCEGISTHNKGGRIPIFSDAVLALRNPGLLADDKDRLRRLDQRGLADEDQAAITENLGAHDFHFGAIDKLGERWGFIRSDDESRWFFHINFLSEGTRVADLNTGVRVKFKLGQNSSGPCAINVSKVW